MKKACFAFLALALAGCVTSPEITAWNMANDVSTPAGYQNFVDRYPNSGHADEARKMVVKSKMEQLQKIDTVGECIRVIKTNPDPNISATVADLALKATPKETSVVALYDFLTYFKGHSGSSAVRSRLEDLEFKVASEQPSPGAMEYFLLRYPQSRFAAEGQKLLAEKSYEQAKEWGNQFGFKAFLQNFPESQHAAEVRGWLKPVKPSSSAASDTGKTLAQFVDKSPWLKRHGCALYLSEQIRNNQGNVDSLRHAIYTLENGATPEDISEDCSSASLSTKPGTSGNITEALQIMTRTEGLRKELANQWKTYGQRDEMAKTASRASAKVADELESAELSEEVLGSGPLGGLDVGREKGSLSARKALERFNAMESAIARDREEIKHLLLETDAMYKPLQRYITNCLTAGQLPGGGP
ncbi:MAG: hypothetical protein PHP95_06770 [Desulfuromonadaceae bacterium]|nr:hypothetical protein [Desulfuromonadaceae bacterium]MDD2848144.1 hypothetical protein [Desulfuromonadaceae bacterium]MDD4132015.1 hypothetical protein [Desulfuromonadaceae bacterium]